MSNEVVNLRDKPARPYCLIDRRTIYGNPFEIGKDGDRKTVVKKYAAYFEDRIAKDRAFRRAVLALRDKKLACWCAPKLCHGHVIAAWLESEVSRR